MTLEKHYRGVMILGCVTLVFASAGLWFDTPDSALIGIIAIAMMAVASWAKSGWDNRPRP